LKWRACRSTHECVCPLNKLLLLPLNCANGPLWLTGNSLHTRVLAQDFAAAGICTASKPALTSVTIAGLPTAALNTCYAYYGLDSNNSPAFFAAGRSAAIIRLPASGITQPDDLWTVGVVVDSKAIAQLCVVRFFVADISRRCFCSHSPAFL
jgi:hypothetical protein